MEPSEAKNEPGQDLPGAGERCEPPARERAGAGGAAQALHPARGGCNPPAAAVRVLSSLRRAGHEAYFVGGCVRDRLLGRPVHEYDIATSAAPEAIERLFPRTVAVGKAFGVMIVVEGERTFEVATFRADGRYLDGRHPESVAFGGLAEDAARRDFTINALYEDPDGDRVIDFVGGRDDLARGLVRAVGDPRRRFDEDKLRMMRAVRFACQLGFSIDPAAEEAIRGRAAELRQVSFERIREELRKILVSPRRADGIDRLLSLGLLDTFLPEVRRMVGVPQPPEFHPEGDVYAHTLLALRALREPTFEVALAVLLHDVGKPDTIVHADRIRFDLHDARGAERAEEIGRRLHLTNEEIDRVVWLVRHHLRIKDVPRMRKSTLKRFLAEPYLDDLLMVVEADTAGSHGDRSPLEELAARRAEIASEPVKPEPLVRGRDLIELGLAPGPEFGVILEEAYELQLEGTIATREDALAWLRRRVGR